MEASTSGLESVVRFVERINLKSVLPDVINSEEIRRLEVNYRIEGEKVLCSSFIEWSEEINEKLCCTSEGGEPSVELAEESTKDDKPNTALYPPWKTSKEARRCRRLPYAAQAAGKVYATRRCDGPCRKVKPVRDMIVLGRCEHVICNDCDRYSAKLCDTAGGSGCPNQKCLQLDLALLCPNPEKRRRKLRDVMKIESVDSSLVGIPQTETDASEATVFLDYDTDTELEDDLFASISVSILDSGETPPVNVLQGKMFPKDASLLTSVRAVLFGSEQRRLKIENIKDRCFVANKLHSREEWVKVKADDWKSELSHFVSPSGDLHLMIDFTF